MTRRSTAPSTQRDHDDLAREVANLQRQLRDKPDRRYSHLQDDIENTELTDGQVRAWQQSSGLWVPKDRLVGIVFAFGNSTTAVAVSTSTDVPAIANMKIVDAVADLKTAGSTSTVATIYKNGTSIGTVTLAASDTNETDTLTLTTFTADVDGVGCAITTAGTGALGLTVLVRGRLLG